jgi:hypothetical protein
VDEDAPEEAAAVAGDRVEVGLEREVTGVEQVDLRLRQVAVESACAVRAEAPVVGAQTASSGTWLARK